MKQKEIEEKKRELETCSLEWWKLELRDMVNSVWCYHNYSDIEQYLNNRYIKGYTEHGLSLKDIEEITINQVNYLNENCEIRHNVYTDCDGLTYNSIVEKENK